jgi:hypothetical protein
MFELIKIVGMSAVLSAGLVTASEMQPPAAAEPVAGKVYSDRVPEGEPMRVSRAAYTSGQHGDAGGVHTLRDGKGDAFAEPRREACAAQAWPHVAPECLSASDGSVRRVVRTVTVEQREGANTSLLVRVPAVGPTRH